MREIYDTISFSKSRFLFGSPCFSLRTIISRINSSIYFTWMFWFRWFWFCFIIILFSRLNFECFFEKNFGDFTRGSLRWQYWMMRQRLCWSESNVWLILWKLLIDDSFHSNLIICPQSLIQELAVWYWLSSWRFGFERWIDSLSSTFFLFLYVEGECWSAIVSTSLSCFGGWKNWSYDHLHD